MLTCVFAAGGGAETIASATLTGKATDPSGLPVPHASIVIRSAVLRSEPQALIRATQTTVAGEFQFSNLPPGSYVLQATAPRFGDLRLPLLLEPAQQRDIQVRFAVAGTNTAITVTAEMAQVAAVDQVPQAVGLIGQDKIAARAPVVLSDVFAEEPGVSLQRTSPAMGGVFVRGLTGRNVAVFRDGVRYTTSAQRGGVSTFLNLIDPAGLDSIEVLRGPNSAQYGSDAVGGTVHLLSRVPGLAGSGTRWHGEWAPHYFTAAHTFGSNALAGYGTQRAGLLLGLSALRANTVRTGGGLDSHAAITRFLGLPSTTLGERLPDTGFTQYGGMLRFHYALTPRQQLVFHYERGQQDGSKRYDQLLGGDGNLIADVRNIMLDFAYLRWETFQAGPLDRVSLTLSHNAQREERVNQGGLGNPAANVTNQYERIGVWGLSGHATKQIATHTLVAGGEWYAERMSARGFTTNPVTAIVRLSRPRVPNGATFRLYGAFAQDTWEVLPGRLRLSGAVRISGVSYVSRAAHSPLVDGAPLFPDDRLSTSSWSGRFGLTIVVREPLSVSAHYSRGFRAPSMTDLGTVGVQGNGFYEAAAADLAGLGATVGSRADAMAHFTGMPLMPLRPETSDNFEAALRLRTGRLRLEAIAFLFDLSDVITSKALLLAPGAPGRALGDQVVSRQLPNGAIFVPIATNPVLVRTNFGHVRSTGYEQSLEVSLTGRLRLRENLTAIRAWDTDTRLPPDLEGGTPPITLNVGLMYSPRARLWAELYGTASGRQSRLSSLSLADRRIGAARSRSDIASFMRNAARVRGLVTPDGRLAATGETVPEVQSRVLGSVESAPLFPAIPGYAATGVRLGWNVTESSTVLVNVSNIFDKNYRGMSWGIDAPGRALSLHYKLRF